MKKTNEMNQIVEKGVSHLIESSDSKMIKKAGIILGIFGLIYYSPRLLKGTSLFIENYKHLKKTIKS